VKKLLVAAACLALAAAPATGKGGGTWVDPAGDAGSAYNAQPVPGAEQGGFDLIEGSVARKGKNLVFTVTSAEMPPFATLPEAVRFMWAFAIDGESYRVTAKSAEVGKPSPVTQENADQIGKVYTDGFFRLEGDCGTAATAGPLQFVECHTLGYVEGTFDPANKSFSFSVPMKAVKAKPGSVVTAGTGDAVTLCYGGPICWTSHTAERSSDRTLIDIASWTTAYKVPR
jgi:hypothetical protein